MAEVNKPEFDAIKERAKAATAAFELHVALLKHKHKLGDREARALAYVEGRLGLDDHIGATGLGRTK